MIDTSKLAMIDEAAAGKIQRRRKVDQYDAEIPTDGVLATRWTKELVAAQAEVGSEPDGVILLCGKDIVPEPVRWLWDGW
jgi:hypothetical protein